MPKKTKRRGKVKDKWKEKQWIMIHAPPEFQSIPVAYVPITSNKTAINSNIQTSLFDLYKKDPTQYSINLNFQITEISSNIAKTIFKGHEYSREYLRSLIRRGSSTLSFIHDYTTQDNFIIRIYFIAFGQGRLNSSKKHDIRLIAHKIFTTKSSTLNYSELSQEIIHEKIASDIFNTTKNVKYLRKLVIHKTKLIKIPKIASTPSAIVLENESPAQVENESPAQVENESPAQD